MSFEENAAYALASWAHFNNTVFNELPRGVTGAFALVAAADGNLAQSEVDRFMQLMHERAEIFAVLDFDEVESSFRDICGALISDPEQGKQKALECIATVKYHEIYRELVRSAAEIAMFADDRERAAEQEVLGEICGALGIDPR